MAPVQVLLVDDGPGDEPAERLADAGLDVVSVTTDAIPRYLSEGNAETVVCVDGTNCDPVATVESLRENGWTLPVVVTAKEGSAVQATAVLGAGADDYVALSADAALADRLRDAAADHNEDTGGSTARSCVGTADSDSRPPIPLESVAGSLSEVVVTVDDDGVVQYVNEAVEDVFGYDRETIVGSPLRVLLPECVRESDTETVAGYLRSSERELDWSVIELSGQHADGHETDIEASFGEFTADGERWLAGVIRDMTPETEREAALSDLYTASQALLLADSPREIANVAIETADVALNLPVSGLYRYDESRNELVPMANSERAREMFGPLEPFEPGDSLAWQTFEAGEVRVYDDVDEDPLSHNPETDIRTELQVPVGERWLLISGSTEDIEFADYKIEFAELLANHTATALRRADRTAQLKRYEKVFDTIDDRVCVLDRNGRFEMVNHGMCRFLDSTKAALLWTSVRQFLGSSDADKVQAHLRELQSEERVTMEVEMCPNGESIPCEINLSALSTGTHKDGVVAAIKDITDRRRVESALAHEKDRFKELFENVPDPAVEVRFEGSSPVVKSVNAAFERTFGYEQQAVVGRSLNEFVLPSPTETDAEEMDRRAAAGELVVEEVKRETGDGIRYFLFRGIPVETEDETVAFGIYTDVTEQRLRERRLGVLNRVLRHNIRNNMGVVLSRAALLEREADDERVTEQAGVISRTAHDVVELAEGIRDAEQALSREDVPERPLDEIVSEAVEPYRGRDGVVIRVEGLDQTLPSLDERAGIAIGELVDNAVEHGSASPDSEGPQGAVEHGNADGEEVTVEVSITTGVGTTAVTVSDDGPGIPDNERSVIERQEGTQLEHSEGIGLWLVQAITTVIGSEVELVENGPDGAVIKLVFPAASTDD